MPTTDQPPTRTEFLPTPPSTVARWPARPDIGLACRPPLVASAGNRVMPGQAPDSDGGGAADRPAADAPSAARGQGAH